MKALVAQKGAREHFLAARALHQQGLLAGLVADWYAPQSVLMRQAISSLGKKNAASALAASCDEIPRCLVQSFPIKSLYWKWRIRQLAGRGKLFEGFDETDAAFARALTKLPLPEHDVFFGYSYASLEMLEFEKRRGVFTVLDQIDPGPVEHRLVAKEMTHHPELEGLPGPYPKRHFERARQEWELADLIVVNSEWSREALVAEGAKAEKIQIIPLAYESNLEVNSQDRNSVSHSKRLQVLWLGQVNVRKGIHYLLEAARMLGQEPLDFVIAGPVSLRKEIVSSAPGNVRWLGPVPRNQVSELYKKADVFVLPTLSDGFALTQLEALAHGLPVIVTDNCGRVVEDGKTGFVIPAHDSPALVSRLLELAHNPRLLSGMQSHCPAAASAYSVKSYAKNLCSAIESKRRPSAFQTTVQW